MVQRYDFAEDTGAICTCCAVLSTNGEYVLHEEYNRLEMQLLRVQARLMRVYAELDKLKDVDSCEHAFELYPNGVIQCIKCGFSHA